MSSSRRFKFPEKKVNKNTEIRFGKVVAERMFNQMRKVGP